MRASTNRLALVITTAVLVLGIGTESTGTEIFEDREDGRAKLLQGWGGEYKIEKISPDQLRVVIDRHHIWLRDYDTASSDNLAQMFYRSSPQVLIKSRYASSESGHLEQERVVTDAVYSEQWRGKTVWDEAVNIVKYVFFNLPAQRVCIQGSHSRR